MRDVDLSKFLPSPHHAYFGHLSSSPGADAVGFGVYHVDNGRLPCGGADTVADDGYDGDIHRDASGLPYPDVVVQYCRIDRPRKVVQQVKTDTVGKHEVWLEPGAYQYHYVDRHGVATRQQRVEVRAGRLVHWQTEDAAGEVTAMAQEIGMVVEDLLCDWNTTDGEPFLWSDIERTVREVNALAPFRFITTDKLFCKPGLVMSLQAAGVGAFTGQMTEQQIALAYRNLMSVGRAGCLRLSKHERADYQLRNVVYATEKRVVAEAGQVLYLANLRACGVYYAAHTAAAEQPQALPVEVEGGAIVPRSAAEAVSAVLGLMAPAYAEPQPVAMRDVLIGEGGKF